ncbi:small integral membrane protein 41 [Struthio camelus]|uniref:small integral membrane protein 41 n=1 Tax=Struthio camelus TaxID=8801 RepID=UPI003603B817
MNSTLAAPSPRTLEAAVSACCSLATADGAARGEPGSQPSAKAVQIAVLCVLCLTVAFGIFFLGCNLLVKLESLVAQLAQERRASRDAEVVAEGT